MLLESKRIKITPLYNDDDASFSETLHKYLVGLERDGLIEYVHELPAGAHFQRDMELHLQESQVIILLTSNSFDADERCSGPDMVALIKKCYEKGIRIWPIIVRHFLWERSCFKEYKLFFGEDKPVIASWTPSDEPYKRILKKVNGEIDQIFAEEWAKEGDTRSSQMQLADALSAYEQSLRYNPIYPPALLEGGRVLRKLDELEKAKQYFETIVALDIQPQLQQAGKGILFSNNQRTKLAYLLSKGQAFLELRRFSEACRAFQEVYTQISSPVDSFQKIVCAEAYYGEGDACLNLGNQSPHPTEHYNQALTAFSQAEKFAPGNPKYPTGIANTYVTWGNRLPLKHLYEQALGIYDGIINHHSTYAPAYVGRGDALYHLQRFEEALIAYEKALSFDPHEARAYGQKGYLLLKFNNPQGALFAFNEALFIEKKSAEYHYGKGLSFALLKRYQDALAAYNKARILGCKSVDLIVHYATVLLKLGDEEAVCGRQAQADSYYIQALVSYQDVLNQPWNEEDYIHYGLGRAYFALQDWNSASLHYQKAIELAPNKAESHLEMGRICIEHGNSVVAFNYFQRAHELCCHPSSLVDEADILTAYGDAYYYYSKKLDSKQSYDCLKKALEYYRRATDIRKHAMAYFGLGKTYEALHYYREAIDALDQALKSTPQFAECYFIKGKCYYELDHPADAYALYRKAITFGFDNAPARNPIGDALLKMKRYSEATDIFDEVITDARNGVAHAYCGKGTAFEALGRYEEALQCFQQANKLAPSICLRPPYSRILQDISSFFEGELRTDTQDALAYKNKGDVLLLLGERMKDAKDAYTRAIEYGGKTANVYCGRGEAYSRLQEYRRAIKDYREALKIDPSDQQAQQGKEAAESMIAQHQGNFLKRFYIWATGR